MSVRHILGNGMFELTNFIPYGNPLADVQMLLCPSLLILGVTMYKAEGRKLNGMKKPILNSALCNYCLSRTRVLSAAVNQESNMASRSL